MTIFAQAEQAIQEFGMFKKGDRVLVGVSGGADSVALLYVLKKISGRWRLKLHIAHLNHLLRSDEAERDQRFVLDLANRLNLPLACQRADVKDFSKKSRLSVEEAARNLRYKFLIETAEAYQCQKIALGHNQNDQAETVLMRFLRGSGIAGLGGIPATRRLAGRMIIRPLINVKRSQILEFLADKKIPYCTDSTNSSNIYLRNRIRNQLLPLIEKEFNANIKQVLVNIAENISVDLDYLEQAAKDKFKTVRLSSNQQELALNANKLILLHKALQRLICRLAIRHLKGDVRQIDFRHWKELESLLQLRPGNSIVDLPGNISAVKKRDRIIFYSKGIRGTGKALVNKEKI